MKVAFSDMDGTLLGNNGLSQETIDTCLAFQIRNKLVLATGRNLKSVADFADALQIEKNQGALILVNGMIFYDFSDGEIIKNPGLTKKQAKRIVRMASLLLFRITVVTEEERLSCNALFDYLFYFARLVIKHKRMPPIHKLKEYPQECLKIELGRNVGSQFLLNLSYKLLKLLLPEFELTQVGARWIEVMPKGTNKANYVNYYIQKHKLDLDQVYVFGDGENDYQMLQITSHSYAVDNASELIKKTAKYHCASNRENGVATILKEQLRGEYESK